MERSERFAIAVLAGGESRRMGRDKGEIEVNGVTMLRRVVAAASPLALPILVVGRDAPEGWDLPEVRFINDPEPKCGPLGAIAAALEATGTTLLAVACDMPYITIRAFAWLARFAEEEIGADGVIALNEGRMEPLFSLYALSALPLIRVGIQSGDLSLKGVIARGDFMTVEVPEWMRAELRNINTPEDLDNG